MPVAIKFTYSGGTPTTDKQAAALKDELGEGRVQGRRSTR